MTEMASMRPRSFERGNRINVARPEPVGHASMRPRSFERGNLSGRAPGGENIDCFNEAALFRARKSRHSKTLTRFSLACFNEAALFRARKYEQMDEKNEQSERFNEAALFRARKYGGENADPKRYARFNEAALFRARKYKLKETERWGVYSLQ